MKQKKATFCIAVYNDTQTLKETLANIYETVYDSEIDIIVVDDAGNIDNRELADFPEVKLLLNKERRGVGYSLHKAIKEAQTEVVFPMGCDIRFSGDWMPRFLQVVKDNPKSLVSTVCAGLNNERRYLKGGENHYYAARILFKVTEANNRRVLPFRAYLEAKWGNRLTGDVEEVGCALGAFYGTMKDWYMKVSTQYLHQTWGTLEPWLSMSYYLHGGNCLIDLKTITGHIFMQASSQKPIKDLIYNKLVAAYLYLPSDMEAEVFQWARTLTAHEGAFKSFEQRKSEMQEARAFKESFTDEQIKALLKPTGILNP